MDRLQAKESLLIDTIQGPVRSAVLSIFELVNEARHEGVTLQATAFESVPLWWGSPLQSGIENWSGSVKS